MIKVFAIVLIGIFVAPVVSADFVLLTDLANMLASVTEILAAR